MDVTYSGLFFLAYDSMQMYFHSYLVLLWAQMVLLSVVIFLTAPIYTMSVAMLL